MKHTHRCSLGVTEANGSSFHYQTLDCICLWMETEDSQSFKSPRAVSFNCQHCGRRRRVRALHHQAELVRTHRGSAHPVHRTSGGGRKDPLMMSKDESGTEEVG